MAAMARRLHPKMKFLLYMNVAAIVLALVSFLWIAILLPVPISSESGDVDALRASLHASKGIASIVLYIVGIFLPVFALNIYLLSRLPKGGP
jgi:hypothetical protein